MWDPQRTWTAGEARCDAVRRFMKSWKILWSFESSKKTAGWCMCERRWRPRVVNKKLAFSNLLTIAVNLRYVCCVYYKLLFVERVKRLVGGTYFGV